MELGNPQFLRLRTLVTSCRSAAAHCCEVPTSGLSLRQPVGDHAPCGVHVSLSSCGVRRHTFKGMTLSLVYPNRLEWKHR